MKTILLIDSDSAFAQRLAAALGGRGLGVNVVADGQEGFDAARAAPPDAIVLAAELPRTSGYAICNRLKKDDALRAIPLVVTSSGSAETFEQHKKLRTRAEEYLAKPFTVDALLERLAPLLGLAEIPPAPPSELADAEALEAEVTIEGIDELDSTLAALDEAARSAAAGDLDLRGPADAPATSGATEDRASLDEPGTGGEALGTSGDALDARLAAAERERDELRARVAELEAQLEKHEARVVKAYERLKGDEAVKERTRRALAIALQLLDGAPPAGDER